MIIEEALEFIRALSRKAFVEVRRGGMTGARMRRWDKYAAAFDDQDARRAEMNQHDATLLSWLTRRILAPNNNPEAMYSTEDLTEPGWPQKLA